MKAEEIAAEAGAGAAGGTAFQPADVATASASADQASNSPWSQIAPRNVLYVGNIFFESTEDDLRHWFEEFGTIDSVKLIRDQRGLSKG